MYSAVVSYFDKLFYDKLAQARWFSLKSENLLSRSISLKRVDSCSSVEILAQEKMETYSQVHFHSSDEILLKQK